MPVPLFRDPPRPAASTARVHILRLSQKKSGAWLGCALNVVDVVNPHGFVLGQVQQTKLHIHGLLLEVRFPGPAEELVKKFRTGELSVDSMVADKDLPKQKALEQCLTSHSFTRSQGGFRLIETYMRELPQLYAQRDFQMLTDQGTLESWIEMIKKTQILGHRRLCYVIFSLAWFMFQRLEGLRLVPPTLFHWVFRTGY